MSVADLNDNCFVIATELLVELSQGFAEEIGRAPTMSELAELLTTGAQSTSTPLLSDAHNRDLKFYIAAEPASPQLKTGDLVAVPLRDRWGAILYLGTFGSYGKAFGVYEGTFTLVELADGWQGAPISEPVFAADDFVRAGRWLTIANLPERVTEFPEPATFYAPGPLYEDNEVGEYGLIELISGASRLLTEEEADIVFRSTTEYRHTYWPTELETYLALVAEGLGPRRLIPRPT